MNTIIEIITIMGLLFSGLSSSGFIVSSTFDYPWYVSYNELYESADAVIICSVDSAEVRSINVSNNEYEVRDVYTVSNVRIESVIKGDVREGDYLEVKQYGGLYDNRYYVDTHSEFLSKKSGYLLFLETYDDTPASLLNPSQGMYYITGTEITPRTGNNINISYEQLFSE